MSLLGPVLIAGGFALMIWLAHADKTEQKIAEVDASMAFGKLPDTDFIRFYYPEGNKDQLVADFYKTDYTCILYIPYNIAQSSKSPAELYFKKPPGFAVNQYIRNCMEDKLYELKLLTNNINPAVIKNARQTIILNNMKIPESGRPTPYDTDLPIWIGFVSGVLIFVFMTVYGAQVMRSVMEEKTTRIVEVIISSVKPFQLMMGKIIGVALVGITQFLIWTVLSLVLTSVVSNTILGDLTSNSQKMKEQAEVVHKQGSNANFKDLQKIDATKDAMQMLGDIKKVDFTAIIICFFLYFIGGYLFYSALFAAMGSAVDSEADTQQFMLPIMLPLTIGYVMTVNVIQNPDGNIAFWGSMIPFTSPIVMMARLPQEVPVWQILLSLWVLVGGLILTVWVAGRIYRTGILMHGKKVTWREIIKWVSYKA